ncbi:hypothetical protein [Xanthomonas sp. MUS 060]|uniref:hypothetical protein n=1 Tax=Xanthomonas sp. MUS 060 TaxID=1588031 RepID=UPI00126A4442|nr:hypothetical protein [Xanthomonas sp. MUS 060]
MNMKKENKKMAGGSVLMDDAFSSCLVFFEDAVRSLSKTTEEIFDDFDAHLGVSWEVRQEILAGKALLEWGKISKGQKEKIRGLILAVEEMPRNAYAGSGINDLKEPIWEVLRKMASAFLAES